MIHYHILLAHWISLWYTTLSYWPSDYPYDTVLSSTGQLDFCGTPPSPISPLAIPMIHCSSTGPLKISMVQYLFFLAHWLYLCYTAIFYWTTGYFYGTLQSSTGQLDISMEHSLFTIDPLVIPMLHCNLLLAHWIWYTTLSYWPTGYLFGSLYFPIGPLAISMVHYCLLLDQWLSLLYTALFYWPTGYLFSNLPSSTCPLDISMEHYPFLLVHLLSLWYTSIFYWPTGYLWVTLSSPIGTLVISMVHYYLLLATGYLYGTLPFPIGPLAIPMLYFYLRLVRWIFLWYTTFLQLAHWLFFCYTAIFNWPTGYLYGTLPSPIGPLAISMVHVPFLLAHWLSLWYMGYWLSIWYTTLSY